MASGNFPVPVDREAQPLQLAAHGGDVLVGPGTWVHAPFDRRVFRRQTKGIPSHRVEHLFAAHPGNPGDHIGDHVVADVAHVQVPRRIGKHRKGVIGVVTCLGGAGLRGAVALRLLPVLLPALFDRLGLVPGWVAHGCVAHCRLSIGRPGQRGQAAGVDRATGASGPRKGPGSGWRYGAESR